jgi:RecA/RadA recombinase
MNIEKNEVITEVVEKEPEVAISEEDEAKKLYAEFSSFLEKKEGFVEDVGVKLTVSTGIDLADAILGGGFAIGALNIVVGQPGSGKTMLAIQVVAQGQKQYKGKLLGAFLDAEESTTTVRMSNLGVRYPKIKPYVGLTVESVFKFLETLCVFKQEKDLIETPSIVVWDSIANTLTRKEMEVDDPKSAIGYKARVLSMAIPQYVSKCAKNNICLLAVNQLRDVMSLDIFTPAPDLKFMTSSKTMSGGNVLKFNAFQLVEMKVGKVIEPEKLGFEGIRVKMKCVKNKLFPPNVEISLVGSFTSGFSNFWTNYEFLRDNKRMVTGAWNYLVDLPEKKFRTKDALKLYNEHQEFREAFDKATKETIQTEIIDKYDVQI